jgi:hypothetical protein
MPTHHLRRPTATLCAWACAALLAARAAAGPLEFISPRDPIVAEMRVLECYDLPADSGRFRLPHFSSLPLQRLELMGNGPPFGGSPVRTLLTERLERELQRDAVRSFADSRARRSTPRTFQRELPGEQRVELSLGLQGAGDATDEAGVRQSQWRDGTGVEMRAGVQLDRWQALLGLTIGELRGASRYTDVLVSSTDIAAQTDEAYLAYSAGTTWAVAVGRMRFAWGPGEEGSLLLSRTAAPLSALYLHGRIAAWRADGFVINATTDPGRGEQLAAHRLEWQPSSGVRLGVSEAARYRSAGWQAVYLAGVIPYSLAQRLLQQDGDTAGVDRNNVMLSFDAAWRPADGTRFYGELLLDDVHAKTDDIPNKYGWQAGVDGAWTGGFTRLTWNTEYTWISRYVYTSFFGRSFVAQGAPLGYPTGPDSRRLHVRLGWDPRVDWQLTGVVTRTWKGENGLDEPFVPGSPVPPVGTLEGVPETTDDATGTLRWWPASGVDLSLSLGWLRSDNAGHVTGAERHVTHASLAFRLER